MYGRGQELTKKKILKSLLYQRRTKNIKKRIIIDIWILFETEAEKEERKKQKHNERLIN